MLTVKIGSRESELAKRQALWVRDALITEWPGIDCQLMTFKTKGDKILDVPLSHIGGKGLFTKELELALQDGSIDIAVHSMKDVPTVLPPGLTIGAMGVREDPSDVLVSLENFTVESLPYKAKVGTSSLRRRAQLHSIRPDLQIIDLRGNIHTRLNKMEKEGFQAIVLAAAGLKRLFHQGYTGKVIPYDICLPAVGQGAIGMEIRDDDTTVKKLLAVINHNSTEIAVRAERAFLGVLEGGCQVPVGALATTNEHTVTLQGVILSLDGRKLYRGKTTGSVENPESIGRELAYQLLSRGADVVLQEVRTKYAEKE